MARSTHYLSIPSSTRYLEDVRRFVAHHAQQASFPDAAVEQFKIAVDEACTNVIKHAYKGESAHQIDISVVVEPDRFTIRIQDEGVSFVPSEYREPDLMAIAKQRRKGGFGVHIMRRLMDQVEYLKHGPINEVRLTKYRPLNGKA